MTSAILATGFNDVQFDEITRNGEPWLRVFQIGRALGYSRPESAIAKIYSSHADEFTESMPAVVTLPTPGGPQETRIFSLRGCHLLAMFSRTPVAKAFRVWVLDVLERIGQERHPLLPPASITPEQQNHLRNTMAAKMSMLPEEAQRAGFAQGWSRFNRHFKIARYDQLPRDKYDEAMEYLVCLRIPQKALPEAPQRIEFAPSPYNAPEFQACKKAEALIDQSLACLDMARDILEPHCAADHCVTEAMALYHARGNLWLSGHSVARARNIILAVMNGKVAAARAGVSKTK